METDATFSPGMEPKKTPKSSMGKSILIILVLLLIIAVVLFINKGFLRVNKRFTNENVTVVDNKKITPVDFPQNIPIEADKISASTTMTYPDRKATLSSVTYFSTKRLEDIFTLYETFLKDGEYKVETNKSLTSRMYKGTKNNTEVNISIIPQTGRTMVQINYIVRQ